jgi:hypothetical protein
MQCCWAAEDLHRVDKRSWRQVDSSFSFARFKSIYEGRRGVIHRSVDTKSGDTFGNPKERGEGTPGKNDKQQSLHYEHIITVVWLAYPNGHIDVSKRIGGIIVITADYTHTSGCFRKSCLSQDHRKNYLDFGIERRTNEPFMGHCPTGQNPVSFQAASPTSVNLTGTAPRETNCRLTRRLILRADLRI